MSHMLNKNTCIVVFGFVLSILGISHALPPQSKIMESKELGPPKTRQMYQLKQHTTQGSFSQVYEIVGGYQVYLPAVMKLVDGSKTDPKVLKETEYLQKVGLYLWAESNSKSTVIVMRDIRHDYPGKGNVLKFFHEWYLENDRMDVLEELQQMQRSVKERLMRFATEDNLIYYDCHMGNIFTDRTFHTIMPIDWAPLLPGEITGVVSVDASHTVLKYDMWLDKMLPGLYSLRELKNTLANYGKRLRRMDADLLASGV